MSDEGDGGRWVTVQQAAAALDRSERTIRRMISDGRLTSRREGARLFVDIADHVPAEPEPEADIDRLSRQVDILQAEIDKLRALVDQVTGERDYLRSALASALQLRRPVIEQPQERRRWRWRFWETE